jgi:hypothetical protein
VRSRRGPTQQQREIGAAFGWTYTKTDRCLKEGRAALRRRAGT